MHHQTLSGNLTAWTDFTCTGEKWIFVKFSLLKNQNLAQHAHEATLDGLRAFDNGELWSQQSENWCHHQVENQVGVIHPELDVEAAVRYAYNDARMLCESCYLTAPKLEIKTHNVTSPENK